ncbi:MAG TPA: hypothetical protein VFS21_01380 [Roseiflexaceae bacterium]|nr:hypothetical protein [Roseiflexaceae bacterium]
MADRFPELEQFLGRGDERVFWRLSMLNIGGALLGFFLGQRLGELAGMHGPALVGLALLPAILGIWFTSKHRGVLRMQRLWLWVRWRVRSLLRPPVVDAGAHAAVAEEEAAPVVHRRREGALVLRSGPGHTRASARLNGKG